MHYLGT